MKNNPTQQSAEFHWPDAGELGYIAASVLMPYVLACILLAV